MISAFLVAILIIAFIIIIVVIIMIAASRNSTFRSSSSQTGAACSQPPVAPTNLVVNQLQLDLISLTWDYTANTDSYVSYLGDTAGFAKANALMTRTTTSNSSSFGNLALGKTYYLKVEANNQCGRSPISNEVTYNVPYVFPTRFTIARATNPVQELCDSHSFDPNPVSGDKVNAYNFCDFRNSWAYYNSGDQSIRQSDRTGYCLSRSGPNIYFNPCTGGADQKWAYDTGDTTLCNSTNANDCLLSVTNQPVLNQVTHGPPTTPTFSGWIFKPV